MLDHAYIHTSRLRLLRFHDLHDARFALLHIHHLALAPPTAAASAAHALCACLLDVIDSVLGGDARFDTHAAREAELACVRSIGPRVCCERKCRTHEGGRECGDGQVLGVLPVRGVCGDILPCAGYAPRVSHR